MSISAISHAFGSLGRLQNPFLADGYLGTACAVLGGALVLLKAHGMFTQASLNNFSRDSYDWRREVVLVTGGSGGLGDLLVRKLAKDCIKVISLDVVPPRTPMPSNAFFYKVDISTAESIKRVADQIRRDHGDPTVLVNNAGVMSATSILEESEETLRLLFDINIVANFLLVKEFLPAMIKRNHGHIVNIASMASFVTGARNVSYSATKVALLALHEGLAQELLHVYKADRVRTSIIHPTYIRTAMLERLLQAGKFKARLLDPEPVVDAIFRQIKSGNSGQVYLPGLFSIAATLRGWPSWFQKIVRSSQSDVLAS